MNEEVRDENFSFPLNSVIGLQAEACFEAFLKASKNYKLLSANLQIQDEKETLGEIDYIIQNIKTHQVIHIELACKFYLFDKDAFTSEEEKWIGPNRKDSLFEKLEKIKHKQFPILQKTETIETLKSLDIEIPSVQELCLKAFLFIPKEMKTQDFPINYQECIVGNWIKFENFDREDKNAFYSIPNKKEWLLPLDQVSEWYSFSEIKVEIGRQININKSTLIYKKTQKSIERFFIGWW